MSHSLIGADRGTHAKIFMVALTAAVGVVMAASAVSRTQTEAQFAHTRAGGPVVKAGKPIMSATTATPLIR
jgi:hypothetical protein